MGTLLKIALFLLIPVAARQEKADPKDPDTPQVKALRAMQKVLKDRDWGKLYADHCHPDLRKQLTEEEFKAYMGGERGKPVVDIFDDVLKAIDAKADKTVLLAQPQKEEGEYEFILVKVRAQSTPDRRGRQWHLELKTENGLWRFLDTD